MYKSVASVRLKDALSVDERAQELMAQPLQQHIMLISAYFANWRDYMEHYEEELLSIVSLNDLNRMFIAMLTGRTVEENHGSFIRRRASGHR